MSILSGAQIPGGSAILARWPCPVEPSRLEAAPTTHAPASTEIVSEATAPLVKEGAATAAGVRKQKARGLKFAKQTWGFHLTRSEDESGGAGR